MAAAEERMTSDFFCLLPVEVHVRILSFCTDGMTLVAAVGVSQTWRNIVISSEHLWQQAYFIEFGKMYPRSNRISPSSSYSSPSNILSSSSSPSNISSSSSAPAVSAGLAAFHPSVFLHRKVPELPAGVASWRQLFIEACTSQHRPYLSTSGRMHYATNQIDSWRLLIRPTVPEGSKNLSKKKDKNWRVFPVYTVSKGPQTVWLRFNLPLGKLEWEEREEERERERETGRERERVEGSERRESGEGEGLYDIIVQGRERKTCKTIDSTTGDDLESDSLKSEAERICDQRWFSALKVLGYELAKNRNLSSDEWMIYQAHQTGLYAYRIDSDDNIANGVFEENGKKTEKKKVSVIQIICCLHSEQFLPSLPFRLIQSLPICDPFLFKRERERNRREEIYSNFESLEEGGEKERGDKERGEKERGFERVEDIHTIKEPLSLQKRGRSFSSLESFSDVLVLKVYIDFRSSTGGEISGSCCASVHLHFPFFIGSPFSKEGSESKVFFLGSLEGISETKKKKKIADLANGDALADVSIFTKFGKLVLGRAGTELWQGGEDSHLRLHFIPDFSSDSLFHNTVYVFPSEIPPPCFNTSSCCETDGRLKNCTKKSNEKEREEETETETESEMEIRTEIGTGTETETEIEIGTETETEIEIGTETETDTDAENDTETETETGTETATDTVDENVKENRNETENESGNENEEGNKRRIGKGKGKDKKHNNFESAPIVTEDQMDIKSKCTLNSVDCGCKCGDRKSWGAGIGLELTHDAVKRILSPFFGFENWCEIDISQLSLHTDQQK